MIIKIINILRRKRIFDLAYIHMDAYFHKQDLLWLNAESVKKYCVDNKESIVEIEPGCDRIVYSPPYFQLYDGKEHHFPSPPIYVAMLHGVFSVGGAIA